MHCTYHSSQLAVYIHTHKYIHICKPYTQTPHTPQLKTFVSQRYRDVLYMHTYIYTYIHTYTHTTAHSFRQSAVAASCLIRSVPHTYIHTHIHTHIPQLTAFFSQQWPQAVSSGVFPNVLDDVCPGQDRQVRRIHVNTHIHVHSTHKIYFLNFCPHSP